MQNDSVNPGAGDPVTSCFSKDLQAFEKDFMAHLIATGSAVQQPMHGVTAEGPDFLGPKEQPHKVADPICEAESCVL